jgi:hypothetical protein
LLFFKKPKTYIGEQKMALKKLKKIAPAKEVVEEAEEAEVDELDEEEEVEVEETPKKKSSKKPAKKVEEEEEEEVEEEDEAEEESEDSEEVEEEDEAEEESEDSEEVEEEEEEEAPAPKKKISKKAAPVKKSAPVKKAAAPVKKSAKKSADPETCITVDGVSEEVGPFGPDTFISKDSQIRLVKKVAAKRLSEEFDETSVKAIASEVFKVVEDVFTACRHHATFKFGDLHIPMRFISGRVFTSIGDGNVEMVDRLSTKIDSMVIDLNTENLNDAQKAALAAGREKYDEKHGGKKKTAAKKVVKKKK